MSVLLRRTIAQAFGGAAGGGINIADVFSIDTFTGAQTLVNGIDFATDGGMFWGKAIGVADHQIYDTERGTTKEISSNLTTAEVTDANGVTAFNSNGVTVGSSFGGSQVGWSFKKSTKFIDVIPYTGDSIAGRTVAHALGVQAGLCFVKRINTTGNWLVQHVSRGGTKGLVLDNDAVEGAVSTYWNDVTMSDTVVTLGTSSLTNNSGDSYVMYVFAHDPSVNGVIQCGEFDATGGNVLVDLSWSESAQYVMIKPYDAVGDWEIFDTTRGITEELNPNLDAAETTTSRVTVGSGGFTFVPNESTNYVYMAVRAA